MARCDAVAGSVDVSSLATDQLKVEDEKARGFAHQRPVFGLQSSSSAIKLQSQMFVDSTQLQGASTTVPATVPWLYQFLQGLWGSSLAAGGGAATSGSYAVDKGSVIVSNTTSTVTVTGTHGARFRKGQWINIQTGAATLQPVKITNIATDTLSVWPNIPAGLTPGWVLTNGWTFAPAQYHTGAVTVQHAKSIGSSVTAAQWTANGCIGDVGITWTRNQLPMLSFDLKSARHVGPSSQAIGITPASPGMSSSSGIVNNVTTLLQAFGTTTSTVVPMLSASAKFMGGQQFVNDTSSSSVQGTIGSQRIPPRPFATGEIKTRFDPARTSSDWTSQTALTLVQIVTIGSGLTARHLGWEIPNLCFVGEPKNAEENGMLVTTAAFEALEDVNITSPLNDLDYAPARLFFI